MNATFQYNDTPNVFFNALTYDAEKQVFPIPEHWHYYTEFLFVIEGTAEIECYGKKYCVSAGDLIIIYAKNVHSIASVQKPLKFYAIKFDLYSLDCYGNMLSYPITLFSQGEFDKNAEVYIPSEKLDGLYLRNLFERCIEESENRELGYDTLLHNVICNILVNIVRIWKNNGFDAEKYLGNKRQEYTIDNIDSYIDRNFGEKLLVRELADMCGMSYSYFAKVFREKYGRSCKEYIEYVRICKAEEMLMFTDYDMNYISQEVGFSDCSHFIRTFKRFRNQSPLRYKKNRKTKM